MSDINNAGIPSSPTIEAGPMAPGKMKKRWDPKGKRNLIIIGAVILFGFLLTVLMAITGNSENAKASQLHTDMASSKGGAMSQEEIAIQKQMELHRVQQEQDKRKSGIEQPVIPNEVIDQNAVNGVKSGTSLSGPTPNMGNVNMGAQQAGAPAAPALDQETMKGLENQMAVMLKSWGMSIDGSKAAMTYERTIDKASATGSNNGNAASSSGTSQASMAAKRGAVVVPAFEKTYTGESVNTHDSDHPGAIRTRIHTGPLQGAVLYGSGQLKDDGTGITYTDASFKGRKFKVNAIAIDEQTASDIVEGRYNGRYIQRFALPIVMEGIKAFTAAKAQTGTEVNILGLGGIAQSSPKPTSDEARNAMISAATGRADRALQAGPQTGQAMLDRGKTYGVVFIEPVYEGDLTGETEGSSAPTAAAAATNQNAGMPMPGMPGYPYPPSGMPQYATPGTQPLPGQVTNSYPGAAQQQYPQPYQQNQQFPQYSR